MRKTVILTIALAMFAVNAYAASAPTTIQGFNASKNVGVEYIAGTGNATYGAGTKHLQGDKIYGGTSASAFIWMKTGTAGTAITADDAPTAPTDANDSALQSGWTSM
jgi:hypothetical protein